MKKPLQILHLEDNHFDAELVKEILNLENVGFIITNVDNKEDFLKEIESKKYDLILADYSLPSFDGLSALQLVKGKKITTPFILVSAVLGEELAIEALHEGATDYVLKSRLERLVPAIQRALREVEERNQRLFLEEEISELIKQYQKIAERVRGFLKMDLPSGKFTLVDKFIEELSGYSTKDWYDTPNFLSKIVHPDYLEYFNDNFSVMQDGIVPKMLEYKIQRKDGEERWWLQFTIGSYDIDQKLISVSIVIVDNTEAKESFIKYQNLFENALVGMYRTTIDTGEIIEANERMAKIFGFTTVDEIKRAKAENFYLDSLSRDQFINAIKKRGYLSDYPLYLQKKDGTKIWCSFSAKIYPREGYIEGVVIDISQQKQAQQDLITREKDLESIFEHTGTTTIISEQDMMISKTNHQIEELVGYTKDEVEGKKKWIEFIHPDDLPKMIQYHKERRSENIAVPNKYELRLIHKDGRIIPCYITVALFPEKNQSIASLIDLTDKKKAEEQLKRERLALQLLTEAIINSTNIEEFCSFFLEGLIKILSFDSGSLRIYNKKSNLLIPMAHFGLSGEAKESLKMIRADDENLKLTKFLGQAIFAPDVQDNELLSSDNFYEKYKYRSFISWPIFSLKKEFLGSIQLGSIAPTNITDEDKNFFQVISELFSTALERKIVDEELKEIEQKRRTLEHVIENSQEVIIQCDEHGIIFYVNPPIEGVFGYSSDEILGKSLTILVPPGNEDLQLRQLEEVKEKGKMTFESIRKHKDGTLLNVIMTLNILRDEDLKSTIISAIIVDITDIKKLEASLKDKSYELEVLNKVISAGYLARNINELFDFTLNAVLNSLDFSGGAIFLIDEKVEKAILYRSLGLSSIFTENAKELSVKSKIFSKVFKDGKLIMATDYMEKSSGHMDFGISSLLAVPFISKQKIIGALFLSNKEKKEITTNDIMILEVIGREFGSGIAKMIAEEELLKEQKNTQILLDTLDIPLIIFNITNGNITKTNNLLSEKVNIPMKELLQKSFYDLIKKSEVNEFKKRLQSISNFIDEISIILIPEENKQVILNCSLQKIEISKEEYIIVKVK
ncbi:MAG: PAS domain S-box protein [Candidatus Thorarchaeota archaeon]